MLSFASNARTFKRVKRAKTAIKTRKIRDDARRRRLQGERVESYEEELRERQVRLWQLAARVPLAPTSADDSSKTNVRRSFVKAVSSPDESPAAKNGTRRGFAKVGPAL